MWPRCYVSAAHRCVVERPSPGLRLVERVRAGLRRAVADRRPEPRGLVPALVLGDTSGLDAGLTEDFRTTGLAHLTAVSGANLTLLLAFLLTVARWVGVRGWWLRMVGLVGVIIFVALCRTEPSVLRAAAMGLVALAALGSGSRAAGVRNLAVASMILLLLDPFLSRSIGFALSVLACAGIVWWARSWTVIMNRWLPVIIAESIAVPLAAQLATVPVLAAISERVSVAGLVANALAGPFVGPATVLGFTAAGASLINGTLAAVFGFGAAWSAQVIIWIATVGSQLPGSEWHLSVTPLTLAWVGISSLLVGLSMAYVLARPWLSLLLAGVMIICLGGAPRQPGWPPRDWVMVACDVGQGDGLAVRTGRRSAIVVDSGPEPTAMRGCPGPAGDHPGAAVDHHPLSCRPRCWPDWRPAASPHRSAVAEPAGTAWAADGDGQAPGCAAGDSGECAAAWYPSQRWGGGTAGTRTGGPCGRRPGCVLGAE